MLTKAEIEAKLLPNGLPPADSPTWPRERAGSFNVYVCNRCRGALVVVLLDWGTTPFLVSCQRAGRNVILPAGVKRDRYCSGHLQSSFYRVSEQWAQHVAAAFYRPADTGSAMEEVFERMRRELEREALTSEDRARVFEEAKRETIEHVERGGLLLRDLTEPERAHWRATLAPSIPTKPGTGGRFA